jgi:hypothetical protein
MKSCQIPHQVMILGIYVYEPRSVETIATTAAALLPPSTARQVAV